MATFLGCRLGSSGVQAAAQNRGVEAVTSSGCPFDGGIWGIFPGHITLQPAIFRLLWKFRDLLSDLPLYKFPSCIISQMCFYSEELGAPTD